VLTNLRSDNGATSVYSHELADAAGVTAAQVRRDIMLVGAQGSPTKGYDIDDLVDSIGGFLDAEGRQPVALIGVGNLGRAILTYFHTSHSNLEITAGFDRDPYKVGRVINGCRCYSMEELSDVIARDGIQTAVLAVPASEAQTVAVDLIAANVKGLLNFVPERLRVPHGVFIENMDITASLEKVAFFARQNGGA